MVWSLFQDAFYQLGLSSPHQVQAGCIEILLDPMTSGQAQRLLEKKTLLEEVLNKVHVIPIILILTLS